MLIEILAMCKKKKKKKVRISEFIQFPVQQSVANQHPMSVQKLISYLPISNWNIHVNILQVVLDLQPFALPTFRVMTLLKYYWFSHLKITVFMWSHDKNWVCGIWYILIMVAASLDHMITICNLPGELSTIKISGENWIHLIT